MVMVMYNRALPHVHDVAPLGLYNNTAGDWGIRPNIIYAQSLYQKTLVMPQSLAKVYVHLVFSTKYRQPLIDDTLKPALFAYLGGVCQALECHSVRVGGHDDHVHILCTLSRKVALMDLLEEIKKRSSKWAKTQGDAYANFYWQDGYGAFSVSASGVNNVVRYIENQAEHHRKKPTKTNFAGFWTNMRLSTMSGTSGTKR
jgi:putative transposase